MRSLFHFPFPCTQPPSQQPSPTATVPLQPEMSYRPHPAPVRHRRRSPALLSAVRPLPALIAPHHLSTAPLLPAPIGLASSTSRPPRASPSRVASAPGPWLARTAPYASLFRRMREKGPLPGDIRPKCMLFEIRMVTSSPHASIPGCNRAIRDTWRANLAAKGPFSRRGTRNHAWREDVASAARPFRGSATRSPHRCISPPARRTHPASHAGPPRPGNKRNSTNNSMRA